MTKQIKQPWQMTREEYATPEITREEIVAAEERGNRLTQYDFDLNKKARESSLETHRCEVERVLAEGKTISAEVLADYPDLRP